VALFRQQQLKQNVSRQGSMPGFMTTHKMHLHLGQVPPGRILIQAMPFLKWGCLGSQ